MRVQYPKCAYGPYVVFISYELKSHFVRKGDNFEYHQFTYKYFVFVIRQLKIDCTRTDL